MRNRFLVCTAVLVGASLPLRGLAQGVVLEVALLLALGSVVRARRTRRPTYPRPWDWLGAGLVVLLAYSVVWFVWLRGTTYAGPVLAVVPVLTFGSFVVASACVLLRGDGRAQAGLVDAGIVTVAVSLVLWACGVGPDLGTAPTSLGLASMACVLALGVTTGCLVTIARAEQGRTPAVRYLVVAAGATTAGFAARIGTTTAEQPDGAWWITPLWIVAFCATAAAVWHPTVVRSGDQHRCAAPGLGASTLGSLGAVLAVGPLASIALAVSGREVDGVALGAGMLALVALVVLRIGMLARAHERSRAGLERAARRDELTGLANRRELGERLSDALNRVGLGTSAAVTVVFCDLDGFKAVNDVHGHAAGDRVLAVVARRLARAMRADDVVARLGGDEFVIVAEGDPTVVPREVLRRVTAALADPVRVDGTRHHVRASTGTAVARPGEGATADGLLAAADAAMYRQKNGGLPQPRGPRVGAD